MAIKFKFSLFLEGRDEKKRLFFHTAYFRRAVTYLELLLIPVAYLQKRHFDSRNENLDIANFLC